MQLVQPTQLTPQLVPQMSEHTHYPRPWKVLVLQAKEAERADPMEKSKAFTFKKLYFEENNSG